MRSTADRIRHALSFEIIALLIVTPASAWLFDKPIGHIGVVAVVSASIATGWNYLYNLGFDHALRRLRGTVKKTVPIRVLHAVSFEIGLLFVLLPFIAWYLEISLREAFLIDVSLAVFYLIYAFVFNWIYDVLFPVSEPANAS
ncbi:MULTISPECIES: PACE efflux transporter [Sulfitobacter]|uniref:PACE efflux transporter n=1 Tax=Sulfitobacter TaxID=60136 RepID=UPI002307217D|nr:MULTISPECIES: PACE efflux transporter [Sulfitobacter]MDF3382388.1 PACE efflux transporter [Sulfitobacter sp. Ks11]MDF3385807.1 PACE efflux transporter [Sulfitobacter sp. M85]MDF3389226.1 PACE efflux transporter [Sulfitobacter sp. Ks16]MDF3399863.1 PACE efflux transporter [Sulfitobacter sp. KE39]MDF3403284.1 PACE efflux transporter [Sulfitobacter sp. Ks35]